MNPTNEQRMAINIAVIGISILAWILLLINPGHVLGVIHCHLSGMGTSSASLQMMLMMNPISGLLTGWTLMVIAMMLPKLILPIQYIYARSLKSRRFTSALLFASGYTAIWIAAGIFILATELLFDLFLPGSSLPLILITSVTLVWQISPAKQSCLNKGHTHPTLAAFGWPASRDALKFGLYHGLWCVASGWALMLFPMLIIAGHQIAMIFVTLVMLGEHLEHPQTPRWRNKLRTRLLRISFVQATMRLKQLIA